MIKLYEMKHGRTRNFYICQWESGLYSLDRIAKGFGGSVFFGETLEEVERFAAANGYKRI